MPEPTPFQEARAKLEGRSLVKPEPRKNYTGGFPDDVKQRAVKFVKEDGMTVADARRKLYDETGFSPGSETIKRWVDKG